MLRRCVGGGQTGIWTFLELIDGRPLNFSVRSTTIRSQLLGRLIFVMAQGLESGPYRAARQPRLTPPADLCSAPYVAYRYGIWNIDIEYWISIWDAVYRYGYLSYRYGHPGYRYGIWAHDIGDDSIDMVILGIDMGYLVTLIRMMRRPYAAWFDIHTAERNQFALDFTHCEVGRCRLTVSKPVLKAPLVSALEATI